ncbi:type II toxin-antitoxin system HicB family antitoxin [Ruminococcus sp.]|uniref:type II toxin-antitoxin system HicB family antitoxin n=1 Tax=Ruminococcus sp. TaxID=41978 RepID=UPI00261B178C|nr:type II toxin-antitoxin system HicB family antitoxin [Ruminococcus sp.]MDD6988789.1 type II toxin-antitoxin system HicB family antitoxin [Ruminococcus sp.]
MKKLTYLAVFEPSADGYGVYFPDLPGCISFGENFETALKNAEDALGLHLYGMEKDHEEIPTPSLTPVLDEDTEKGALISPVTVFPDLVKNELDNKRVKTNVTLPVWLKELAEQNSVNYSRLLENALTEYLHVNTR